jgi:hypothetical protein
LKISLARFGFGGLDGFGKLRVLATNVIVHLLRDTLPQFGQITNGEVTIDGIFFMAIDASFGDFANAGEKRT